MRSKKTQQKKKPRQVGYAVVGLGWIAQSAALPAFKNAAENSKVVALVSGDPEKLKQLGQKYHVPHLYLANQIEACFANPDVDAVYLALPNHLHAEYTELAARHGKHVLCEKPMGLSPSECIRMREVCQQNRVRLMVGYRLHFDPAMAEVMELIRTEKIGRPRLFTSVFSYRIQDENNYRLKHDMGGGPLLDIGIYCINAARHLFQSEPVCVTGFKLTNPSDPRFSEVEEAFAGILKFSNGRSAQFSCSFGAGDESSFKVLGSKGKLELQRAFELTGPRSLVVTQSETEKVKTFPATDMFSPEFLHFSECILSQRDPLPSGREGLADVRIMQCLYRSAEQQRTIVLEPVVFSKTTARPLVIQRPPVRVLKLIHSVAPAA